MFPLDCYVINGKHIPDPVETLSEADSSLTKCVTSRLAYSSYCRAGHTGTTSNGLSCKEEHVNVPLLRLLQSLWSPHF